MLYSLQNLTGSCKDSRENVFLEGFIGFYTYQLQKGYREYQEGFFFFKKFLLFLIFIDT
jgi:hypothetical protein